MSSISVDADSYVVCVHGCNGATKAVLENAHGTCSFAVMPCCIPKSLYGIQTHSSRGAWALCDEQRYAFLCGAISAKFFCHRMAKIDRRITNRNFILFG